MEENKSPSKKKIFKQAEILGAIISGIEEVKLNHYTRITPFTKSLSLKNVTPHVHTIKGRLTEGYLWQEMFSNYNIEFDLDDDGFVVGFKVKEKRDEWFNENVSKKLEIIKSELNSLKEEFKNTLKKEKNAN